MRLAAAVIATVYLLPAPSTRLLSLQALAAETTSFTRQVSPSSETNATEPSVAVDRSDGTEWVAWQASGTHVARSAGLPGDPLGAIGSIHRNGRLGGVGFGAR